MEPPSYSVQKTDGVSIGDNPKFEQAWAKFARWSWLVLSLFVAAGLTGVLGAGPMSSTVAGTKRDAMQVKYDRYARFQASSLLRIELSPTAVLPHNAVRIFLSRSLVKTLNTQRSNPHPALVQLVNGGEVLIYPAQPNARLKLELVQQFRHFGIVRGRISLPGQMDLSIRQLVYP